MQKRNLVALLTNDLVGSYQYALWAGMKAAAREDDCGLVSFNGGELGSSDPVKSMRNTAFDLVRAAKPDAIVVAAPVLVNALTEQERKTFVESFAPIPVVTVGVEIPGHPSVVVDNAQGMNSAVEHVVTVHGRRRLVFMGGIACNPDAMVRREAFLKALQRHGIQFDPDFDLVGDYDFGVARDRMRTFMDARIEFDGVIAANDEMALGVMEALKERGRKIPDDVVVFGFDDIEDSQFASPALATVRQPVFQQGEAALRMALDLIDGAKVESEGCHPAILVRRGSCGCHSKAIEESLKGRIQISANPAAGPEHLEECRKVCRGMPGCNRLGDTLEVLAKAMAEDVQGEGSKETMETFRRLLETQSHPEDPPERWQMLLSRLRSSSLPFFSASQLQQERFESLVHQMRVLVHERASQLASYRSLQIQRWTRLLNETGCKLVNSFDEKEVVRTLAHEMKGLQISSIHLILHDVSDDSGKGRLVLSVDPGKVLSDLPDGGVVFDYQEIFEKLVHKAPLRSTIVVEPLFFGKTQLGFVFLELALRRGVLLDILRGQISAALMGSRIARAAMGR